LILDVSEVSSLLLISDASDQAALRDKENVLAGSFDEASDHGLVLWIRKLDLVVV